MEPVPPSDLHGVVDRHRGGQRRHLDVHGGLRLADDGPQSGPPDRVAGPGRREPAGLRVCAAGGRARRAGAPGGLPVFVFALPAGALADIIDRRRFLIGVEVATTTVSAMFAALVVLDLVTPINLLVFTFLIG